MDATDVQAKQCILDIARILKGIEKELKQMVE